jgi:hypothetical protein
VYPSRTPALRRVTLTLASIWTVLLAIMIAKFPSPPRAISIASLGFPVYYVVLSLWLNVRRAR